MTSLSPLSPCSHATIAPCRCACAPGEMAFDAGLQECQCRCKFLVADCGRHSSSSQATIALPTNPTTRKARSCRWISSGGRFVLGKRFANPNCCQASMAMPGKGAMLAASNCRSIAASKAGSATPPFAGVRTGSGCPRGLGGATACTEPSSCSALVSVFPPRPYSGMSFSSDTPALQTGHVGGV